MNNKMNVYLVDDSMEMIHSMKEALTKSDGYQVIGSATNGRSEERRVGKECRSRWSPYH